MKSACFIAAAAAVVAFGATNAVQAGTTTTFYAPGETPYLSISDSPFSAFSSTWNYSWVEDFESGAVQVPGMGLNTGHVIGNGWNVDSVDADDEVLDGSGNAGHSWFVPGGAGGAGISLTIDFDANALGGLPTHAGLVWTDGNYNSLVTFTAYDANGIAIGSVSDVLGDTGPQGSTDEDRFIGVEHFGGISSIELTTSNNGVEIDHVQFAQASVPGPSALAVLAGFGFLGRRRRR